jgi:hypothetical protein
LRLRLPRGLTLYRYLAQLAQAGHEVQVGWGRSRAVTTEELHGE